MGDGEVLVFTIGKKATGTGLSRQKKNGTEIIEINWRNLDV